MLIILAIICLVVIYLLIERIKNSWLRRGVHLVMWFVTLIAASRFGSKTGDAVARAYVSLEVQDLLELVQKSSQTNTVEELRAKLDVLKNDIPDVIYKNDRQRLLNDLHLTGEGDVNEELHHHSPPF